MSYDERVNNAGIKFKMWVLGNYKVLWHQLSDTTLNEALEMWNTFR